MKRENSIDILRIIAFLGIVAIHVSGPFLSTYENNIDTLSEVYKFIVCLFNCIGRFGVPVFLMISGEFLLKNEKNADYKVFYKKSIKKLFIPTFIFSIIFFIYKIVIAIFNNNSIMGIIKYFVIGKSFYHMWYMYMLIGVYVFIPVLIKIKKEIGEEKFKLITYIYFPISIICLWTTKSTIQWNPGISVLYLSYVMLGYVISNNKKNKSKIKFWLFLIISLSFEILMSIILKFLINSGNNTKLQIQENTSPLSALAGIFMFLAFNYLRVEKDWIKISNLTFYGYIIHALILDIILKINIMILGKEYYLNVNPTVAIPSITIITFLLSLLFAYILKKIIKRFSKNENHPTNSVTKL